MEADFIKQHLLEEGFEYGSDAYSAAFREAKMRLQESGSGARDYDNGRQRQNLPLGWEACRSDKHGRDYFYHEDLGQVVWTIEEAIEADAAPSRRVDSWGDARRSEESSGDTTAKVENVLTGLLLKAESVLNPTNQSPEIDEHAEKEGNPKESRGNFPYAWLEARGDSSSGPSKPTQSEGDDGGEDSDDAIPDAPTPLANNDNNSRNVFYRLHDVASTAAAERYSTFVNYCNQFENLTSPLPLSCCLYV